MGRARVVEVDYFQFTKQLKDAVDRGDRIEKADRERWKSFIKEHGVLEASSISMAKAKAPNIQAVIIADGPWTGFYVYSSDDQICLRFERD